MFELTICHHHTVAVFPMKKVEACESHICWAWQSDDVCYSGTDPEPNCYCHPSTFLNGFCRDYGSEHAMMKKMEEDPNLCQSHADCKKKGSGSFCARNPNADIKYGWCFASGSHAQAAFRNALNSEFENLSLKMLSEVST